MARNSKREIQESNKQTLAALISNWVPKVGIAEFFPSSLSISDCWPHSRPDLRHIGHIQHQNNNNCRKNKMK